MAKIEATEGAESMDFAKQLQETPIPTLTLNPTLLLTLTMAPGASAEEGQRDRGASRCCEATLRLESSSDVNDLLLSPPPSPVTLSYITLTLTLTLTISGRQQQEALHLVEEARNRSSSWCWSQDQGTCH